MYKIIIFEIKISYFKWFNWNSVSSIIINRWIIVFVKKQTYSFIKLFKKLTEDLTNKTNTFNPFEIMNGDKSLLNYH